MKRAFVLAVLAITLSAPAVAQQAVFVVRHAERADSHGGGATTMATDPDLSDTGRARAKSLAGVLKDAGIVAIFVTEYKRTQQTAEPVAQALGITPTIVNARDVAALVQKTQAAGGNVLVVGHSNTIPEIIAGLGASERIKLADTDYDDLFVVVRGDSPKLLRIHYR